MPQQRTISSILTLCLAAIVVAGCTGAGSGSPSQTPSPASLVMNIDSIEPGIEHETMLPFEGLWVSEGDNPSQAYQVIVFTANSVYWVQTGNWANIASLEGIEGGVREEFFEIRSYDLALNQMSLSKRWVRTGGFSGGFDSPEWLLSYSIEGDELRFALESTGEFPELIDAEPYVRK